MRRRIIVVAALALAVMLALPTAAHAITREEILSRSKRWVDREVPYSQSAYYDGYRTDCSGMASMAWKLPMSYSTRTLRASGYLVPIHRDQLQPGDMLLKYDYHAAIFYKWATSDHTWYWTLEQSGGTGHAVSRLTPYPFWGVEGFAAFRHRDIEELEDWGPYVTEVAGSTRYATAVAASQLPTDSVPTTHAVVCSGENWPDALGGSALAGALEGPVLLVPGDAVPSMVTSELRRLGVRQVTLIGGEGALSPAVADAIDRIPGVSVRRIGGSNRYDTAALVASATVDALTGRGLTYDGSFYLATGLSFPDALGAATVAAYAGRPILLSEPTTLPADTARAIRSLEPTRALVAGGTAAIDASVTAGLADLGVLQVTRFAGADRYTTALRLAKHGVNEGLVWDRVALATGEGFADALAGAVLQARRGSPLMLTPTDRMSPSADWAIREHLDVIDTVTVLGGEAALEPGVRRQIRWMMDEP